MVENAASIVDPEIEMRSATVTAISVTIEDGGVMLRWGSSPLDFMWQSNDQARDLAMKLEAALFGSGA